MSVIVDSAASQQTRLAVENQYGVLATTPSWVRTSSIRLMPTPQFETDRVISPGDELPTGQILNDEFSNAEVSGRASYHDILYPLASMFGFPTSTLVSGSTYDHIFTWDGRTPIAPASYSYHYGLPGRAKEILGLLFNGLGLTVNRGGLDFSSAAFGKAINVANVNMGGVTNEVQTLTVTGTPTAFAPTLGFKGRTAALVSAATFTAAQIQALLESIPTIGPGNVICAGGPLPTTPITVTFIGKLGGQDVPLMTTTGSTYTGGSSPALTAAATTPGADTAVALANVPLAPLHFDVFGGDTWAEIQAESTKFLALYNVDMGWGEKWQRSQPINSARTSDSIYVGEDQDHTMSLRFGADSVSEGLFANARAGTKKYVRLHATGPATGDAALKYEFVADTCLLIGSTEGYTSENGIHVLTWGGSIARDEVLNNGVQIRVRNKRSGL